MLLLSVPRSGARDEGGQQREQKGRLAAGRQEACLLRVWLACAAHAYCVWLLNSSNAAQAACCTPPGEREGVASGTCPMQPPPPLERPHTSRRPILGIGMKRTAHLPRPLPWITRPGTARGSPVLFSDDGVDPCPRWDLNTQPGRLRPAHENSTCVTDFALHMCVCVPMVPCATAIKRAQQQK